MKSQKASSLGSLIMPTLELMSLGRSSRTTSGQILCSTTWYVNGVVAWLRIERVFFFFIECVA